MEKNWNKYKKEELFELRGDSLYFENPLGLKQGIESFFGEDYNFPLVSGHVWNPKNFDGWKIRDMKPEELSDELTVRNFLGGLEELSNSHVHLSKPFEGEIFFEGVERASSEYYGQIVLQVRFRGTGSNYYLDLKFVHNPKSNDFSKVYSATSSRQVDLIEKIMIKYLGPNKEGGKK